MAARSAAGSVTTPSLSTMDDIAPAIENAPPGPEGCTSGAMSSVVVISRLVGSVAMTSCLKFVPTCAVRVKTSAARPTTTTVCSTAAGPIVAFSGTVCVAATPTDRRSVWNPLSSKVIS